MNKRNEEDRLKADAENYRLLQIQWMLDEFKRRRGREATSVEELAEELKGHGEVTSQEVGQLFQEYGALRDRAACGEPMSLTEQMRLAQLQPMIEPSKNRLDRP